MISLPLSFATEADVLAAYRAAGGVIGSVPAEGNAATVNCAGIPPTFFDKWTYCPTDQLPNLYKGVVDMGEVVAAQAPSQKPGSYIRLDVIERELGRYEFVGAHVAEWYQRPENLAAFLKVCPSGYLVFLEKYRFTDRILRVVFLYVHDGVVRVGHYYANAGGVFDDGDRFAVRRKPNA